MVCFTTILHWAELIVLAPTNVRLMLSAETDNTWQLSCYAQNLLYEIPMVFINGIFSMELNFRLIWIMPAEKCLNGQ
jgi:hypothetical protein